MRSVSGPRREGPFAAPAGPFRQTALARLNTPEQLDRLLTVTTRRSWIALAAFALLIAAALAWSVIGTLATYVTGRGIFMNEGGRIQTATAPGAGTLTDILVKEGEKVHRGQIVARLVSPGSKQQLANARDLVTERTVELARQEEAAAAQLHEQGEGFTQRHAALHRLEAAAKIRTAELNAKLLDEERLLKEKVVTRSTVLTTRAQRDAARQQIDDAAAQIAEIESRELDQAFQIGQRVKTAKYALADAHRKLKELTKSYRTGTEVLAPVTGTVHVIEANIGKLLNRGDDILTVETPGRHLELLLFVSIREGDKVKAGQAVMIDPNATVREEAGTMVGRVSSVSKFAVEADAMHALLPNEHLLRHFTAEGPVFLARVALERDPATVSGYKWTSARGAGVRIKAGNFAVADVLVRVQRPIGLVIPTLRRWTGL